MGDIVADIRAGNEADETGEKSVMLAVVSQDYLLGEENGVRGLAYRLIAGDVASHMADGNVACNTSYSENNEQGADQFELVVGEGTTARRVNKPCAEKDP